MLFAQAAQKKLKRKSSTKKQAPQTIADVIKKSQETFSTSKKSKVETKSNDKPKPLHATTSVTTSGKEGEEDFVRGEIARAPAPRRDATGEQDVLFGVKPQSQSKSKRTKVETTHQTHHEKPQKDDEDPKLRPLQFYQMSVGVKILACIKSISESDLVLSLPGNTTAVMSVREVSDQIAHEVDQYIESSSMDASSLPKLDDMFKVGQLLRTVVVHVTKKGPGTKRALEVSIRPSLVNRGLTKAHLRSGMMLSGSVKSVEEKGYLIDLGIGEDGFLPVAAIKKKQHNQYRVGYPVDVTVLDAAGVITLNSGKSTSLPELVNELGSGSKDQGQAMISMDTLLPGMLVQARWMRSHPYGIQMSFLDALTGNVDLAHLPKPIGIEEVIDQLYNEDNVNPSGYPARVVFVDPVTKHVRLSMRPALVEYRFLDFPPGVKVGKVLSDALVTHVNPYRGVTLQLAQGTVQGFASILASKEEKIPKVAVVGATIPCRVMDLQPMDGLAIVSLNPEVINQTIFTVSDLKPGQFVDCVVTQVTPQGVTVRIAPKVYGFIPEIHLNDVGEGGSKKFVVDATVNVRVLGISEKGQIRLTAKKTLKSANLPLLASYEDAVEGFVTFGVVRAVKENGLVMEFFGNVHGYLHVRDLRRKHVIGSDQGTGDAYSVGQLVQVRVSQCDPAQSKLYLTLSLSGPTALTPGQIVEGVVSAVVEEDSKPDGVNKPKSAARKYLTIKIAGNQGVGVLESTHLTDHSCFVNQLFRSYPVGTKLESLLVLRTDRDGVVLTLKSSLLQAVAAKKLPSLFSEVAVGNILQGYVKNITEDGVFVSFLGNFFGFVARRFVSQQVTANPSEYFQLEQSVRARVETVDEKSQRITLNLRQSAVTVSAEEEGKLLDSYLVDRARAETQELSEKPHAAVDWQSFPIGSISDCAVLGVRDFGILGELSAPTTKSTVTCLAVRPHHLTVSRLPVVGSLLPCRVLDQEKVKLITDISFRLELLQPIPTGLKLEPGTKTVAVIQLVKDNHFVLTLPKYSHVPAVALTYTLNKHVNPHSLFQMGTRIGVVVSAMGGSQEPVKVVLDASCKPKNAKTTALTHEYFDKSVTRRAHLHIGRVLWVKLLKIRDNFVKVGFSNNDSNLRGRVHISEIGDLPADPREWAAVRPFETVSKSMGTLMRARILAVHNDKLNHGVVIDLSLRPSIMVEDAEIPRLISLRRSKPGHIVPAFVISVEPENACAWVDISSMTKGKIGGLDFAHNSNLSTLLPHTPVRCVVTGMSGGKLDLRLAFEGETAVVGEDLALKGAVLACHVVQIVQGRGLKLRIVTTDGRKIWGLVHLTDISDSFSEDPLSKFQIGQVVSAYALDEPVEVKEKPDEEGEENANSEDKDLIAHFSLRPSRVSKSSSGPNPEIASVNSLTKGQKVTGYVKAINKKGCFVSLSRDVVARVLLKNLSDGFVNNPEKDFPPGKLVSGRVTDVTDGKVDMSLRIATEPGAIKDLKVGKIVEGKVSSIQKFGIFIRLSDSNISGLCHISNVADTPVSDLSKHYKVGDLIQAKIITVELEKQRVSLGLKPSLLQRDESSVETSDDLLPADEDEGDDDEGDEGDGEDEEEQEEDVEEDNEPLPAVNIHDDDVPPLPIFSFNTTSASDNNSVAMEDDSDEEEEEAEDNEEEKVSTKVSRNAKASAKKRAEKQLNEKEEQLLDAGRTPESAEDFKRLLASSPDSSFLWIKLMAYHVGITELDKAREVAEQALKTINFREQQEKWNVWIALMNLENLYGTPESLKKVFDRAKERNDAKKITMELCKMYEASEKATLAEEAFEAALKSYGSSGKVWYNYALFFYRRKELDKARAILPRALERLDKRKHMKLIRKMAQAEYTLGTPERGRTIMEGVMSSYPKRVDLWSTYLDMEIKNGKASNFPENVKTTIRRLFERIVHLDLKPRKMKFFFKRYLSFEKDHGDAGSQHHVKALAQSYVDKVIKAA